MPHRNPGFGPQWLKVPSVAHRASTGRLAENWPRQQQSTTSRLACSQHRPRRLQEPPRQAMRIAGKLAEVEPTRAQTLRTIVPHIRCHKRLCWRGVLASFALCAKSLELIISPRGGLFPPQMRTSIAAAAPLPEVLSTPVGLRRAVFCNVFCCGASLFPQKAVYSLNI